MKRAIGGSVRRPRKEGHRSDRGAIQNTASVAALLITTEAMVAELPKKNAGGGMPAGGGGMSGKGGMEF